MECLLVSTLQAQSSQRRYVTGNGLSGERPTSSPLQHDLVRSHLESGLTAVALTPLILYTSQKKGGENIDDDKALFCLPGIQGGWVGVLRSEAS